VGVPTKPANKELVAGSVDCRPPKCSNFSTRNRRVSWVWPIISALPVEWAAVTLSRWGWVVKDVNLVLREKELDIVRVRKEIEALHSAIPLLSENQDWIEHRVASPPPSSSQSQGIGTRTRTTGLSRRLVSDSRSRISAIWHSARSGFRSRTPPTDQEEAV